MRTIFPTYVHSQYVNIVNICKYIIYGFIYKPISIYYIVSSYLLDLVPIENTKLRKVLCKLTGPEGIFITCLLTSLICVTNFLRNEALLWFQ